MMNKNELNRDCGNYYFKMSPSIVRAGAVILLVVVLLCHAHPRSQDQAVTLHRVRRIVAGHRPEEEKLDSYGYVASIQMQDAGRLKHICGGAHVGNGWILTAAHCFVGRNWRNFYVRLGIEDLNTTTVDNSFKVLEVQRNHFMPLFMTNDIALMRIDLTTAAPTIKFADRTWQSGQGGCEVGGYGSPAFNAPLSSEFQVASVEVVPMIFCIMRLGFIVMPSLSGSVLCAGGGITDTCQGDSGTGLVCKGVLVGITSYGRDCGVEGVPAIYTNVEHYASWINHIVNGVQ